MFGLRRAIFLVLVTAVVTCSAQDSRDQANTLVLVFKDGHQKSLAASEVSRIEFNPPRIVLKNGHQENFAAGEILRIEMNNGSAGVLGRNHFVGKWEVGTGVGSNFYITLEPNGQAEKTIGGSHGTWELFNGEARITWEDGWHDAIRKIGSKHEKFAYAPGKSFDDQPSNVTDARNTTAQPI